MCEAKVWRVPPPDVMEMQLQIHHLKRSVNRILEILLRR